MRADMLAAIDTLAAICASLFAALCGAGLLWVAFDIQNSEQQFVEMAWPTHGQVVTLATQDSGGLPLIRFETPNGRNVLFEARRWARWQAFEVGQSVTVLFDPQDLENARVDGAGPVWIARIVAIAGGLLIVVPMLALLWLGLGGVYNRERS